MEADLVALAVDGVALEASRPRTFIKDIVRGSEEKLVGQKVVVGGWVKTGREQGKGSFAFLELNDGSCLANLQVIVEADVHPLAQLVPTGTSVLVEGQLKKPPEGAKQSVELKVEKVLEVGPVDPAKYPIPKTKLTLEFLRDFGHLRARTNTISAVARIRDELAYATHTFFRQNGFRYVHTPIITTSDCEGAGEMFQVTTLFSDVEKLEKELKQNPPPSESEIEFAQHLVKEKGEAVSELKLSKASKQEIGAAVTELNKAKESLSRMEERFKLKGGIPRIDGNIDYSRDFFGRQAFLTVSGQLQVETYACALGNVYTFGPTFRAEHSHTSRHLAEFWMVEPEIAFANLEDDMNYAESYVKFLCQWLLDHCLEDMEFMVKNYDKTAIERLKHVSSTPFERISYTKAVQLLENVTDKKFENEVKWGIDLASEHERYLTEVLFKKPVIVYNYPKGIKAFYMRLNDDQQTVAAMDVLVPKRVTCTEIGDKMTKPTEETKEAEQPTQASAPEPPRALVSATSNIGVIRSEQPKEPFNKYQPISRTEEEAPVGNLKAIIASLKREGQLGVFYDSDRIIRTPILIEINFVNYREAVFQTMSRVLEQQIRKTNELDVAAAAQIIAEIANLIADGVCVMTYMKLRICNYLDTRVMGRFRTIPKVPTPFEVPLAYAFAIYQLGQIKISEMPTLFYLSPSAPEDIDLTYGCTLQRPWDPAAYARAVEYQKSLGIRFTTVDLRMKKGSSWWIYRPVATENSVQLECPYPETNFSEDSAIVALLFCKNATGGVYNPIIDLQAIPEPSFGSMARDFPPESNVDCFYAVCYEEETQSEVGELIGGSQREERLDVLVKRIEDSGLPLEPYEWYLDLRRFGTVKHCGFGLGFERMVLFATGIDNIRDVIPFPRYPGRADL